MQNKVAIVTGGSRGIGAETVKVFAQNGYQVVINYHSNLAAAEATKAEAESYGVQCLLVQADVSNEQEVAHLFAQADQLGSLDVLVNNAGILEQQARLEDISTERLLRVLNTRAC